MQLPDTPLNAMYENEDRDQIRRDLIAYCTQHRIGSPTLQSRIATANDRTHDEVNNKTLQRFLAGKHRTNDAFVWLCHKFLLGTDTIDPVKSFGDAASQFFTHVSEPDSLAAVTGDYEIAIKGDDAGGISESSRLVLSPVAERSYLRAAEEVSRGDDDNSHLTQFEGVAFLRPRGLSLILRDNLTRRQKWHLYYRAAPTMPNEFHGEMMTPLFFGSSDGANSVFRARMTRKEGGEE